MDDWMGCERIGSARVMSFTVVVRRERNYKVQLGAEILGRIGVIIEQSETYVYTFVSDYSIMDSGALRRTCFRARSTIGRGRKI